jgi:hypothetical protein
MSENNVVEIKAKAPKQSTLEKKRRQRWQEPAANAKMEDLVQLNQALGEALQKVHQTSVNIGYTLDVLIEVLVKKGILTKEEIDTTARGFQEKQKKFVELIADTELTPEQKNAIAAEHNIEFDFTKVNG